VLPYQFTALLKFTYVIHADLLKYLSQCAIWQWKLLYENC